MLTRPDAHSLVCLSRVGVNVWSQSKQKKKKSSSAWTHTPHGQQCEEFNTSRRKHQLTTTECFMWTLTSKLLNLLMHLILNNQPKPTWSSRWPSSSRPSPRPLVSLHMDHRGNQNHMAFRGFAASWADPKLWVDLFKPSWRFTAASAEVRERPRCFPVSRLCFCGTPRSEYLDFFCQVGSERKYKPQKECSIWEIYQKQTNIWVILNKMQTIPIIKTNAHMVWDMARQQTRSLWSICHMKGCFPASLSYETETL